MNCSLVKYINIYFEISISSKFFIVKVLKREREREKFKKL